FLLAKFDKPLTLGTDHQDEMDQKAKLMPTEVFNPTSTESFVISV
ncbi:unnamed protein product, partial [Allacma fusca]